MSYLVFTQSSFDDFVAKQKIKLDDNADKLIEKHYLDDKTDIEKRTWPDSVVEYLITSGSGVHYGDISKDAFDALKRNTCLSVTYRERLNNELNVIRFIEKPMKLVFVQETAFLRIKNPQYMKLTMYDYFKRRIGICGGPSAGKSIFARNLATHLDLDCGANPFHVTEYATTFLQKYKRKPTLIDQLFIYDSQLRREQDCSSSEIVISDCPVFLSYIYTQMMCKEPTDQNLFVLSKMYKRVIYDARNYTDIIYMRPLTYKENNIRCYGSDHARIIDEMVNAFLTHHGIKFIECNYTATPSEISKQLFSLN